MLERWTRCYGRDAARDIANASLTEAALDITPKDASVAGQWAERLAGQLLPTGTIRMVAGGRIEDLPGFAEGAWWVQDAANDTQITATVPKHRRKGMAMLTITTASGEDSKAFLVK